MIILSITEGEYELFDGFPEYVEIHSDIPSTIYYTLDGTSPDDRSLIAAGKVYLPTLSGTVTVKAVAVLGQEHSDVLEKAYYNESISADGRRNLGKEGITVYKDGADPLDSMAFSYEGEPMRSILSSRDDLDLKASMTDSLGTAFSNGKTSFDFVNFEIKQIDPERKRVSSPNNNHNFDAAAPVIHIDGFSQDSKENQVVKIVNRPYNTFGPTTSFYKERLGQKEPIITGNYVRSFYNPKTKKYVSFYYESLESRWLRSEQVLDGDRSLSVAAGKTKSFVYRWIQDRALSQLF